MQVFSVHLECANADSHVHILDEPPVFFCDAHVFGKCASSVIATASELSNTYLDVSEQNNIYVARFQTKFYLIGKYIGGVCGACSHERTCVWGEGLLCVWGGEGGGDLKAWLGLAGPRWAEKR